MKRKFRPGRLAVIIALFMGVLMIYSALLYKIQIYDPQRADAQSAQIPLVTTRHTEVISAGRGEILDRNGEKLVSSRAAYNILLSRDALRALGNEKTNEIIRQLLSLAAKNGVEPTDTFPVTEGAPYEYVYDMSSQQRTRLDRYFEYFDLDPEMTASDLIVWLKQHYEIPYTVSVAEARLIIGVRYELEIRVLVNISPYVFAGDVPLDFVATVSERSLTGVSVTTGSVRTYHTAYAAHLLGYIGQMNQAQIETYTELGYPMDALVGQSGIESAFEEHLHGVDGSRTVLMADDGEIVSEEITEAVPGDNIYLSIDIGLQEIAEKALAEVISEINLEREEEEQKAVGGAVVVTEVGTGQVLSMASYPTYDLVERLESYEYYRSLSEDASSPLYNRAAQGLYNPGSTFKPITALAALRAGTITRWTEIVDQGQYMKYETYRPRCWYYTAYGATHGSLDLVEALAHSCNYYFYSIGDSTGPTRIARAAFDFGFGEESGIEIFEEAGIVATVEYRTEKYGGWWDADTLITAIGQGDNLFTPVQMANYAATIANGGTLYDMSLLRAVKTSDYTATVINRTPTVRSQIEEIEYVAYLKEGMRAVVTYGTAREVFSDYEVAVAAKTGTVQTGSDFNDGVFICYAPADNPQIAISVVVEKGGSGAAIMDVAKLIFDEYFRIRATANAVNEGVLIP